jgi:DNA ligase-1
LDQGGFTMPVSKFIFRCPINLPARSAATLLILAIITGALVTPTLADYTSKPALILAKRYHSDISLADYWVSEKLDGVRAYWDGQALISRQGNMYHAPNWFIAEFPSAPLDGELWMGRGRFDELSGAVRKQNPLNSQWQEIRFMVFDLPAAEGSFDLRLIELKRLIDQSNSPYLELVEQQKSSSEEALLAHLDEVIALGGEGLMLHLASAPYRAQRSDDLLKLKRYQDAEATVIGHLPGKGKYEGMLGALLLETKSGLRFKIGSGFSDEQRKAPPPIGSTITYKYFGLSSKGTPRFASFLRIRNEN